MRTFPSRNSIKKENFYELEHKSTSQFTANIILEDIMVWSSDSPTEKVLSSIAGKLIDIHANLWEKIIYLIKRNTRLQELVLSVSDVDQNVNREIVSLLVENPPVDLKSIKTEQKMLLLEVMSNLETLLNRFVKKHSDTIISRNKSHLLNLEGDGLHENTKWFLKHHNKTTRQIKKLEKKLIIVNEQLKIIDKEKGDLLDIIQKSQYTSQIDVVLLKLQKEKEKSAHLQSIVDDMYLSSANNRKHK
ncbi:uncharacterized protein LOC126900096 [Daktulosphaira vitifoliae]|uniref:uncharacterized protein LOC126900096 n=1 Tax=Daktulosphaira vitifoliae TaxID=58002 RepID=UPI0021AA2E15|nr:uncharacterized protein LOC126900096 [Daktulosphaira vitifoliae]